MILINYNSSDVNLSGEGGGGVWLSSQGIHNSLRLLVCITVRHNFPINLHTPFLLPQKKSKTKFP